MITYVGTHATGDAALGTVGPEHEVFDDELAATLEEVQEGNGFLLAVGVEGREGVGFCDFDERQSTSFGGYGVVGAGVGFFLFEEGEPEGEVGFGGDDLECWLGGWG